MARHFPIFIDLGGTPPLVVGAQPALSAKLRLLTGFAPRVELLTGLQKVPSGLALPGVHHIDGISLEQAANRFRGRSLVLIDTGDPALDEMLSLRARRIGVPVIETIVDLYLAARRDGESFGDHLRQVGADPFKQAVYADGAGKV